MGLWSWLFGKRKKADIQAAARATPPPIPPSEELVGSKETSALDITVDEDFISALDWAMQDVIASPRDFERLRAFLIEHWQSSRISMRAVDELAVKFAWPQAEAHIKQQHEQERLKQIAAIEAWTVEEALASLRVVDLKALLNDFGVQTKSRMTKPKLIEALMTLDESMLQSLRARIVSEAKENERDTAGEVTLHEMVTLLHARANRAYWRRSRAEQIEGFLSRKVGFVYSHIRVSTSGGYFAKKAPCGLEDEAIYPAQEVLHLVRLPACAAVDCCCHFSPVSLELEKRFNRSCGQPAKPDE